jgi:hypothetical protein
MDEVEAPASASASAGTAIVPAGHNGNTNGVDIGGFPFT